MFWRLTTGFILSVLALVMSCGGSGAGICTPNETILCNCEFNGEILQGVQECIEEGTALTPCNCGPELNPIEETDDNESNDEPSCGPGTILFNGTCVGDTEEAKPSGNLPVEEEKEEERNIPGEGGNDQSEASGEEQDNETVIAPEREEETAASGDESIEEESEESTEEESEEATEEEGGESAEEEELESTEDGTESDGEDVCGGCVEPLVCNPDTKECVACVSNDQCDQEAGQFCNSETSTCEVDICAACQDPYPACAEINGKISCVQCVEDADCASGDCNETTYFCEVEPGVLADTCKCAADADCPTGTQFNLKCDTNLGLCYDVDGNCDGISACCDVKSGSECIPQLELLASGIELPIPDVGGSAGLCGCQSELNVSLCLMNPDLCGVGKCPGGIECTANFLALNFGFITESGEFPSDYCGEF